MFEIMLAAMFCIYAVGCYYIWTARVEFKKVGGLSFVRIGKLTLSYSVSKK